jgi:hypothetical protein
LNIIAPVNLIQKHLGRDDINPAIEVLDKDVKSIQSSQSFFPALKPGISEAAKVRTQSPAPAPASAAPASAAAPAAASAAAVPAQVTAVGASSLQKKAEKEKQEFIKIAQPSTEQLRELYNAFAKWKAAVDVTQYPIIAGVVEGINNIDDTNGRGSDDAKEQWNALRIALGLQKLVFVVPSVSLPAVTTTVPPVGESAPSASASSGDPFADLVGGTPDAIAAAKAAAEKAADDKAAGRTGTVPPTFKDPYSEIASSAAPATSVPSPAPSPAPPASDFNPFADLVGGTPDAIAAAKAAAEKAADDKAAGRTGTVPPTFKDPYSEIASSAAPATSSAHSTLPSPAPSPSPVSSSVPAPAVSTTGPSRHMVPTHRAAVDAAVKSLLEDDTVLYTGLVARVVSALEGWVKDNTDKSQYPEIQAKMTEIEKRNINLFGPVDSTDRRIELQSRWANLKRTLSGLPTENARSRRTSSRRSSRGGRRHTRRVARKYVRHM